jgi:hypothetical protein
MTTAYSYHTNVRFVCVSTRYTADETGFHPEGEHLPTPPPIPGPIQRAISAVPEITSEKYYT